MTAARVTRRGGGEAQRVHRSVRQLRVGAKGARRRAVHHRTLLAPRACRPCEAAGRAPALCANAQWARAADLGHRYSQTAGQYASTRARSRPIRPSSGALGVRHASAAWHARMHWRTRRKAAPIRRDTHAQRAGRAARAHGSVRACEWHGERGDRPAPTRPTGCGRAVVVAPACAAIRARARFVRRLGTARRRPLPAGLHAAPSPQAASFGRGGGVTGCGRRTSHPLSRNRRVSSDLGPAHSQAASERGGVRTRRCSNDEGRASKNVERPPISPAVGFDSASRHAPVILRSPQCSPPSADR